MTINTKISKTGKADLQNLNAQLFIRRLELWVHLGWPEEERQHPQSILLDIGFRFSKPPKACLTDHLQDTFCYNELVNNIKLFLADRSFKLIEYLAAELYKHLRILLPAEVFFSVRIGKNPAIPQLLDGVVFEYGDDNIHWS